MIMTHPRKINVKLYSLVPRPSPAQVFDHLQYAKTVFVFLSSFFAVCKNEDSFCILQVIKNWNQERPGNEAKMHPT